MKFENCLRQKFEWQCWRNRKLSHNIILKRDWVIFVLFRELNHIQHKTRRLARHSLLTSFAICSMNQDKVLWNFENCVGTVTKIKGNSWKFSNLEKKLRLSWIRFIQIKKKVDLHVSFFLYSHPPPFLQLNLKVGCYWKWLISPGDKVDILIASGIHKLCPFRVQISAET